MTDRRSQLFQLRLAMLAQVALVIAILTAMFSSCAKRESSSGPIATARILTAQEIRAELPNAIDFIGREQPSLFLGDTRYAQIQSASLRTFYTDYRQALFDQGVVKWDERFDCNHFAGYYVARAQTKFYLASFHSRTPAQTLALGVVWYQSPRGPHAIVGAFTERGLVFIEPQTGAELQLSPAQRASAWLKVF